jgi:hypothetical protein
METREKKITEHILHCDKCGKEITGWSRSAVEWNMEIHKMTSHKERK